MESLEGKKVLIGKEPGNARLKIAVEGYGPSAAIGQNGCVPNSVSRCCPEQGIAHASLSVDAQGNMILVNLKPKNVTYVNGSEIASKRVNLTNTVELGRDHFPVSLNMVIETAKKIVTANQRVAQTPRSNGSNQTPKQPPKRYNISHLYDVWEEMHSKVLARQIKQKKLGILASCSMFFTIGSGAIASVANKFGVGETVQDYLWILPVVGFIVFFISMYKRITDTSIEDADATNLEYSKRFVCPNPDCGKFLGNMPYELMKTQYSMHCPYCKCEYYE